MPNLGDQPMSNRFDLPRHGYPVVGRALRHNSRMVSCRNVGEPTRYYSGRAGHSVIGTMRIFRGSASGRASVARHLTNTGASTPSHP